MMPPGELDLKEVPVGAIKTTFKINFPGTINLLSCILIAK